MVSFHLFMYFGEKEFICVCLSLHVRGSCIRLIMGLIMHQQSMIWAQTVSSPKNNKKNLSKRLCLRAKYNLSSSLCMKPCCRMFWVHSGCAFLDLEVHCFSASALWACFWFEGPCLASPVLCWLQLFTHFIYLFWTDVFRCDIFAPCILFIYLFCLDLPWMECNPCQEQICVLSKQVLMFIQALQLIIIISIISTIFELPHYWNTVTI